jgi:hypothetical protein
LCACAGARLAPSSIAERHDPEFHFAAPRRRQPGRRPPDIRIPSRQPSLDDAHGRGIAGGVRCFRQDEEIRGLALHFPVVERKTESASRVAAQDELEPRVLALMHCVAAGAARLEARAQGLDRRRGFRPPGRTLRQREPQQQRIDPGFVADERDRVGGSLLVEANRSTRPADTGRGLASSAAEVSFGGGVAAAMRDFAQQRLGPGPPGAVDAHGAVECPRERRVGGSRVARDAVDRGAADRRVDPGASADRRAQSSRASAYFPRTVSTVARVSIAWALLGSRCTIRSRSAPAASNSCRLCRIVARSISTAVGASGFFHHVASAACAWPRKRGSPSAREART